MDSQHYNIFTGELPECLQMRTIGDILGATLRCLPVHEMMLGRLSVSNGKKAATFASPSPMDEAVEGMQRKSLPQKAGSGKRVIARGAEGCRWKLPGKASLNVHYGRRKRFFGIKNVIRRKLYGIPLVAGILF